MIETPKRHKHVGAGLLCQYIVEQGCFSVKLCNRVASDPVHVQERARDHPGDGSVQPITPEEQQEALAIAKTWYDIWHANPNNHYKVARVLIALIKSKASESISSGGSYDRPELVGLRELRGRDAPLLSTVRAKDLPTVCEGPSEAGLRRTGGRDDTGVLAEVQPSEQDGRDAVEPPAPSVTLTAGGEERCGRLASTGDPCDKPRGHEHCAEAGMVWPGPPALPAENGERRIGLTFDALRAANIPRCVTGFGHALESWSPAEWTNAMCGEAGEAANVAKKMLRHRDKVAGNKGEDRDLATLREKLARELADVVIYADLCAASQGIDLGAIVVETFNRKSDEIGSDVKLAAPPRAQEFSPAPCSRCGYNGPGYYQSETHPCAAPPPAEQEETERWIRAHDAKALELEALDKRRVAQIEELHRQLHEAKAAAPAHDRWEEAIALIKALARKVHDFDQLGASGDMRFVEIEQDLDEVFAALRPAPPATEEDVRG